MKIKKKQLIFHNLLYMTQTCKKNEWYHLAVSIRNLILEKGLYVNAPVIYTHEDLDDEYGEYTVYVPINSEVKLSDESPVSFIKELRIPDALVFRVADIEPPAEEDALILLYACAEAQQLKLKRPFYNIVLNVYNETMIDIVAPIKDAEYK